MTKTEKAIYMVEEYCKFHAEDTPDSDFGKGYKFACEKILEMIGKGKVQS